MESVQWMTLFPRCFHAYKIIIIILRQSLMSRRLSNGTEKILEINLDSNEAACFTKIFSFRKESCLADVEEKITCEDWRNTRNR